MSSVNFPQKPSMPKGSDPKVMMDYQQQMAEYNLALQTIQHTMNQEETTASNMEKSRHDALMAMVNNTKA